MDGVDDPFSCRNPRPIKVATAWAGVVCPSSKATTASVIGMSTDRLWARCQTVRRSRSDTASGEPSKRS